jgi:hypothetical protein
MTQAREPRTSARRHFLEVAAAILLGVVAPGTLLAQSTRIPGSSVSLVPPDGFAPAHQFPGFGREDLQASIVVTEMPGSAVAMADGMTRQALAGQGMNLVASARLLVDGRQSLLLYLGQRIGSAEIRKWMLVTGDHDTTVLVVGTFPRTAEDALALAIRESVLTTSWRPGAVTDPFEGLLFRVSPGSKLKIARRMSNMLALTETGTVGAPGPDDAFYLVGNSLSTTPIGDVQVFAEARVQQTAQTKDVRNFKGRRLDVDGLDAYEIVADAKDARTGKALKVYQVVMPADAGYFIVQGLISAGRAAEMLAEFRRVTASFARVR